MATKRSTSKGSANQDLQAARNELKQFRHDVSILKRKGLLDKTIDARSIKPSKYLKSQIKRFASVLRGEASPVKVSRTTLANLKKRGIDVKSGRAIIPHQPGEKVRATRGTYKVVTPVKGGRIQRLDLALDVDDINQWLDDLSNNRYKIPKGDQLAFQFRGYNSLRGYTDLPSKTAQEQMAETLMGYSLVKDAMMGKFYDGEDDSDVIEGIVIFKTERLGERPAPNPEAYRKHEQDEAARAAYRERQRLEREARLGRMSEKSFKEYRKDRAAEERERRSKLSDAEKEAYRAKAKARAKKSRDQRKKNAK
jgi:hypothetical protein